MQNGGSDESDLPVDQALPKFALSGGRHEEELRSEERTSGIWFSYVPRKSLSECCGQDSLVLVVADCNLVVGRWTRKAKAEKRHGWLTTRWCYSPRRESFAIVSGKQRVTSVAENCFMLYSRGFFTCQDCDTTSTALLSPFY